MPCIGARTELDLHENNVKSTGKYDRMIRQFSEYKRETFAKDTPSKSIKEFMALTTALLGKNPLSQILEEIVFLF